MLFNCIHFKINLLSSDYQLLMSILSKNMTEGATERVPVKKPEIGKTNSYLDASVYFFAFELTALIVSPKLLLFVFFCASNS